MRRWPFVARADELDRASAALGDDSCYQGVALVGPVGVGKTALARKLAAQLGARGDTVRFVLGSRSRQRMPLGAFHHIGVVEEAHDPSAMLATTYRGLAEEPRLVLVVIDVHLLDPLSALLVCQLACDGMVKLILTLPVGARLPDEISALWKEQTLLRLELKRFTRNETELVVRTVLDGDVDTGLVDRLYDRSLGSPLVLRGLVNGAQADGSLQCVDGLWQLTGPLTVADDVDELIMSRLLTYSDEELKVVEIVALAEPLDWEILRTMCDIEVVNRVERRGSIQFVCHGPRTVVRPGHPVIGDVARRHCGVARTRMLNTALAHSVSMFIEREGLAAVDVGIRIQLAQFMIRADMTFDLDAVVRAAASAVSLSNPVLAEELARFACDRGGGLPAELALAEALSWQGRGPEADAVLAGASIDGADDAATARWGSLRAGNLFFGCRQVERARSVLDEVRRRVSSGRALSLITAMGVTFDFFGGDVASAATAGLTALSTDLVPTAAVLVALATAGALALSGRSGEVDVVAERGLRAAEQCEMAAYRYTIGLAQVLSAVSVGDLDGAERVCQRHAGPAEGIPQAGAVIDALVGYVGVARGDLGPACESLQRSLTITPESLHQGWVALVAIWSAQAEGARGDVPRAERALAKAERDYGPQFAVFEPELELARGWVRAAAGELTAARIHAERAARAARRGGMDAAELHALHTAVRFGDRTNAARLRQLAQRLNNGFAHAAAVHAAGLVDHDAERLADAAARFEKLGLMAAAADAMAHASREFGRDGIRGPELEFAARAHWVASGCELRSPAIGALDVPLDMTDREREIATLVGGGLTNRQVADRLGVSVRTVEGHLYRMFAKLQIGDREQLSRLVRAST